MRVIAGDLDGHPGPGVTHTPITMAHATISPGARLTLPWPGEYNALAYVLAGSGTAPPWPDSKALVKAEPNSAVI